MGIYSDERTELKQAGVPILALWLLAFVPAALGGGLTWPPNQYLPTFPAPATNIDCIDISSASGAEQDLFVSLEGIVNRTQPRIACVTSSEPEGEFTWINLHHLPYTVTNGFGAILKYKTNVTGLVVTDPTQPDTLNLATTIAGVSNVLICDPSLLITLTNAPYSLPVQNDLRGLFANKYQVYGYLYTNYWPLCTHRIIAGMETNGYYSLRDYLVAVKAAVVWLDPGVSTDAAALAPFLSGMTALNGVYMGWWPDEGNGLQWIAQYGIPVIASDWFDNGSLFSGVASPISIPAIPPAPPLQNKIYVSLTLSDGDNVQYMQRAMKQNWSSSARGSVPIGWTVQPLAADLDPVMLNYYWSTATTNDCLLAGPSGGGYVRINYWSAANVASYTKASNFYFQRSGTRISTVWNTLSSATAVVYATNCPTLIGLNDEDDGYYTTSDQSLPVIGLPGSANYASAVTNLVYGITNTAASWNGAAPMFIAVQGNAWDITPADFQEVVDSLPAANYVVVRPDHLFLLYREAAGLGLAGTAPYIAAEPASQLANVGSNISFSVIATGTSPLGYQWLRNGVKVAGATNSTYALSNLQSSNAGNFQVVVTNNFGALTSSAAVLTFGSQPLGFNGNGLDWTANQSDGFFVYSTPILVNNLLTLTDGNNSEARSFFFQNPQYIGAFKAGFTYQAGGNKAADGISFCIQNDPRGAAALGGGGGQLGVGTAAPITPSLELELNLYSPNGIGYTMLTNGLTAASASNGGYHPPGGINLAGGDPIFITLNYSNGQLALTFTDAVARADFSTNLNVGDLARLLGSSRAYVGFTGADGGANSIQTITNFEFVSLPEPVLQTSLDQAIVSWPFVPGYALQQNSNLASTNWITVTNQSLLVNGSNQVVLPASGSNLFFRLALPPAP